MGGGRKEGRKGFKAANMWAVGNLHLSWRYDMVPFSTYDREMGVFVPTPRESTARNAKSRHGTSYIEDNL
jgi:hypothetical protein